MEPAPDIMVLNNVLTLTLRAGTERGFTWLRENAGTDEREIELEASHGRDLVQRARDAGMVVSSDL